MYRLDFHEGSGRLGAFAFHSLELRLVWDHPLRTVANASAEANLPPRCTSPGARFSGETLPRLPGVPEWPQYTLPDRRTMIFNTRNHVESQPQEAELQLWNGVL